MNQPKRFELRIENEEEVQKIFAAFFRTMGPQMGPSFSKKESRYGSYCTTYPILKKFGEAMEKGDSLFHANVESDLLWEIDFEKDVVVISVTVKVSQAFWTLLNISRMREIGL